MPSTIEWTDETWNPVTGCTRVSPGCDNCYMFALYPRLNGMGVPGYAAAPDVVTLMPERMERPERWGKPRRVFVNSMSDTFHKRVPFEFIDDMVDVMIEHPQHTFQVLTKRPGRAVAWMKAAGPIAPELLANVWFGTSVENQKYAPRLDVLARMPGVLRFVSAEPLLGPLDLSKWLKDGSLHWVIAGGESGPRARPMETDWVRDLRDQCESAGVPFFFKQYGGRKGKRSGDEAVLDGRTWQQFPNTAVNGKGDEDA